MKISEAIYNFFFPHSEIRSTLNSLFQKHYTVIKKNVAHIDNATILCLGENHTKTADRVHNALLIDTLYQKGDLVLVEQNDSESLKSRQVEFVKSPIVIKGWDDLDFKIVEAYHNTFFLLLGFIAITPFCPTIGVPGVLYGEYKSRKALQAIYDEIPKRNENLCKIIRENPKKRIFVLGGNNHFRPANADASTKTIFERMLHWILPLNREGQNQGFQKLLQTLKNKKFAILTSKPT